MIQPAVREQAKAMRHKSGTEAALAWQLHHCRQKRLLSLLLLHLQLAGSSLSFSFLQVRFLQILDLDNNLTDTTNMPSIKVLSLSPPRRKLEVKSGAEMNAM